MKRGTRKPEIALLGAGRLGSSLAIALDDAGYRVVAVASRRRAAAGALAKRLKRAEVCPARELWARAPLVILAVPDDALAQVAAGAQVQPGQAVVHCSGALGLDVLAPVAERGGRRGCLHPLQAFPERYAPERLHGVSCGIDGDGALAAQLARLVRALGARPFSLRGADRARYHAAAVLASNYVVALRAAAEDAWALAGLPRAQAGVALQPLTRGAVDALGALPLERALTGPIARGDVQTVARHLQALAAKPELHALYGQLAAQLIARPLSLPRARLAALRALLAEAAAAPRKRPGRGARRVI
ncbi:MAG TPA: Rossmann-like and DUF2520 domain-containing protein [Polyangiales bacterium]|nr:Rossmann-like and DUF2520 domain-containing protein [Polyangiales bacterium]